jgi:exosortase
MLAGTFFYVDWARDVALLPMLAGATLLLGGGAALRWAWPAIAFLAFMIPLPFGVERGLGYPLQRIATRASTYGLQLLGLAVLAEGNVIRLPGGERVGVAEACNGLGMLMMFFAYATGAALVVRRPPVDRALIVLSAIPVAIGVNVLRIVVTGYLYATASDELAHAVYHDLAGWIMMPVALLVLVLELWLLDRLLVERAPDAPLKPILRERFAAPLGDAASRGTGGVGRTWGPPRPR